MAKKAASAEHLEKKEQVTDYTLFSPAASKADLFAGKGVQILSRPRTVQLKTMQIGDVLEFTPIEAKKSWHKQYKTPMIIATHIPSGSRIAVPAQKALADVLLVNPDEQDKPALIPTVAGRHVAIRKSAMVDTTNVDDNGQPKKMPTYDVIVLPAK